ncbi:hypothetical protein QQA43_31495 (plasmid) [Mycolicibacterium vanbaalenii]|uniref:hypothetical protein n=1 Tax=Mycolicibacterium vanbaalenii TaxID=110539 RepID=UPI00287729D9|nr:hypothetical protein [Mycolicibacterium vanbaalenii]WND60395.1 hypothetical protein QQA43_31495 [Mycolicibacterium vanbaalenii]
MLPAAAMTHGLAAGGAGISETEVLHSDRRTILVGREIEQRRDRGPNPPVAARRRQSGGVGGNGNRRPDRITRRIQDAYG